MTPHAWTTSTILFGLLALSTVCAAESKIVCTVQTEAPTPITIFLNGWTNGDAFGAQARFYKDINGVVHLEGAIFNFAMTSFTSVAFMLPEGYRPAQDERIGIAAGPDHASLYIKPNGEAWITSNSGWWVTLSSATFRAR